MRRKVFLTDLQRRKHDENETIAHEKRSGKVLKKEERKLDLTEGSGKTFLGEKSREEVSAGRENLGSREGLEGKSQRKEGLFLRKRCQ